MVKVHEGALRSCDLDHKSVQWFRGFCRMWVIFPYSSPPEISDNITRKCASEPIPLPWKYLFSEEGARDASGKLLLPKEDESERQLYLYTSLVMVSSFWIDQMCLDSELDLMILMGAFQFEMFYDSFIASAEHHCLLSFMSCCFQTQWEQMAGSTDEGGTLTHFSEWMCWELGMCSQRKWQR